MKRHQLNQVAILALWLIALSAFGQANAQTFSAAAPAQKRLTGATKVRFAAANSALKIPLEIDNNIILMQVRVNGSRPLKFIFDTGASHSGIDAKVAAELGLKPKGRADGTATGGRIHGTYFTGVSLSVSGAEVSDQMLFSAPFPTVPGFGFDGVIGYGFINQFVVEIDYLNKTMNLYDPRTYTYGGAGKDIPLLFDGGKIPLVLTRITVEGRAPVEAKLEVDTGADGTLIINSRFVKKQQLLAAMPKAVQDRGRGLGGEERRLLGQVKAVQLGQFVMKDPPLVLLLDTEVESKAGDGVVGGEIFRRFKVIIDYSRKRMILEPNKSFNDAYEIERGGE
jgi:predicted aspartyl protease